MATSRETGVDSEHKVLPEGRCCSPLGRKLGGGPQGGRAAARTGSKSGIKHRAGQRTVILGKDGGVMMQKRPRGNRSQPRRISRAQCTGPPAEAPESPSPSLFIWSSLGWSLTGWSCFSASSQPLPQEGALSPSRAPNAEFNTVAADVPRAK